MAAFLFKFMLTGIFFPLIIGAALVRRNKNRHCSAAELILYSMGLGPVFTVLLLYYFLLLIPGRSHSFYLVPGLRARRIFRSKKSFKRKFRG